jgi:hypothetical protein
MFICKHCGKECKNDNSLRNHERLCKSNPNRQNYNLENARLKANEKVECKYCKKYISKTNIVKHELSCHSNPDVLIKKEKVCPVCSKKFVSESITCSYSCSNTHFAHLRNKPDNYSNYRTICFKYHKKQCIICNEDKIVEVHHYNEQHDDNDPKNLVPLCPTHHQYVHSKYKDCVQSIIDEYVKSLSVV